MTPIHLSIDFETRSTVDLKAAGLDNYVKHASTDVWCMGYAFGDEPVEIWTPPAPCPPRIREHTEGGGTLCAHNASFEFQVWNGVAAPRYGWPELRLEQLDCTMARAYAMSLPGSLEKAAAAVGIREQKDLAGGRLMMQMARPRSYHGDTGPNSTPNMYADDPQRAPIWWDDADKLQALYEYCKQDVRVERELAKRLMPLSDDEQALWVLDQRINARGVYVDREAVQAAIGIVRAEQDRLNKEMRRVTKNFVGFCTETARITKWVQSRGVPVDGIAKADVLDALERTDLPADVREALLLRQEAGKSSTAKLSAMLAAASEDGRLRGMFQYHGAGTGRWAGRKVQLHNLPRPSMKQDEIERVFDVLGDVA